MTNPAPADDITLPAMSNLEKLYPLWLKKEREQARLDLARAQQSLAGLKNRQGAYFDSLNAMCAARLRIHDAWMQIPTVPAAVDVGAAQAETALRKVLDVTRRYLPPGGIDMEQAIAEIIGIVDPWPLGRPEKKS